MNKGDRRYAAKRQQRRWWLLVVFTATLVALSHAFHDRERGRLTKIEDRSWKERKEATTTRMDLFENFSLLFYRSEQHLQSSLPRGKMPLKETRIVRERKKNSRNPPPLRHQPISRDVYTCNSCSGKLVRFPPKLFFSFC